MQLHHVRVHRSEENLAREDQLAWKIAELAQRLPELGPDELDQLTITAARGLLAQVETPRGIF